MSPELLDTETQGNRRTKYSDRYALGMVIYEVLSGHAPFYQYANWTIPVKVAKGDRPERPQGAEGAWFTDGVWEVLGCCWITQPKDRPSVEQILQCMNQASRTWTRPSLSQVTVSPSTESPTTNPFEITDEQGMGVDGSEPSSPCYPSNHRGLPPGGETGLYPSVYEPPVHHHSGPRHAVSPPQTSVVQPSSGRLPPIPGENKNPDGSAHLPALSHTPVSNDYDIPVRGRPISKKALLIGIGYHTSAGGEGQNFESLPTAIPNVRAFERFLRGCLSLLSLIFPSCLHHTFISFRVVRVHRYHCHD